MYGCKLQIKYTVKVGRLFSKEKSIQHTNLSYKQKKTFRGGQLHGNTSSVLYLRHLND